MTKKISVKKIFSSFILVLISILIVGIFLWNSTCYNAKEKSTKALVSDKLVEVNIDEVITFLPKDKKVEEGLIFYQGAKVYAKAYSYLAREIAKRGYFVALIDSPLDFAMITPNKADDIIENYPNIKKWNVGGHSLGGVVASNYASKNKEIEGLVLLASYPANKDLKQNNIDVVSIWGSNDGVLKHEKIEQTKLYLPQDTKFIEIQGANHAQFGDYGEQKGDKKASISFEEQIEITVDNIAEMLD